VSYSYLKASIGFSLAALLAGYIPKNIPTSTDTMKDVNIDDIVTTGVIETNTGIIFDNIIPIIMPMKPPIQLMTIDSTKNCINICFLFALWLF
jgi:hypothetical protein